MDEALVDACDISNPILVKLCLDNGSDPSYNNYECFTYACKSLNLDIINLLDPWINYTVFFENHSPVYDIMEKWKPSVRGVKHDNATDMLEKMINDIIKVVEIMFDRGYAISMIYYTDIVEILRLTDGKIIPLLTRYGLLEEKEFTDNVHKCIYMDMREVFDELINEYNLLDYVDPDKFLKAYVGKYYYLDCDCEPIAKHLRSLSSDTIKVIIKLLIPHLIDFNDIDNRSITNYKTFETLIGMITPDDELVDFLVDRICMYKYVNYERQKDLLEVLLKYGYNATDKSLDIINQSNMSECDKQAFLSILGHNQE